MRALIIDDERAAREYLQSIINEYNDKITDVKLADSVLEGLKILKNEDIDIVFLDIEMPNLNGFDFFDFIDKNDFKIVFTTAHEEYAIKAFNVRADGYLLKPVDVDDLIALIDDLSQTYKGDIKETRIAFRTQSEIEFVEKEQIIRVEGDGNYSTIYLRDKKKITVSKNLKQVEKLIPEPYFIKTHQSHIINKNFIKRFVKTEGGYFEMQDDSSIPVSRRKKDDVMKLLNFS